MNIVVAACKNKGIGINNKLPWRLMKDLKYFRFLTQSYGENAIVMGKNTWLFLKRIPDWRWGLEGTKSFWYPNTRIFRQEEHRSWRNVLEKASLELTKFLEQSKVTKKI